MDVREDRLDEVEEEVEVVDEDEDEEEERECREEKDGVWNVEGEVVGG